jgi:lipid-binding SYLF domain-containing protein
MRAEPNGSQRLAKTERFFQPSFECWQCHASSALRGPPRRALTIDRNLYGTLRSVWHAQSVPHKKTEIAARCAAQLQREHCWQDVSPVARGFIEGSLAMVARLWVFATILSGVFCTTQVLAAGDPNETACQADMVLAEIMAIPARQIPEHLLAEAQGVAIIPDVIKIGFIAGARRGHGVVLVRDSDGEWSLPQFVTLTGGSVGWQAGVQGSDVVLVFTTKKGVEGLMQGKFTLGADIAAAAGPVGRNAAAATDERFKAEILSYSRSRGLFLGASIDGSVLEIDHASHVAFYGSQSFELPRQIPASAAKLRQDLVALTPDLQLITASKGAAVEYAASQAAAAHRNNPTRLETLRGSLDRSSRQLHSILSPEWQRYLALPKEVYNPAEQPRLDSLRIAVAKYDQLGKSQDYKSLVARPEFQNTLELLREYTEAVSIAAESALKLPSPPGAK